jgi:hypothetical protein
MCKSACRNEMPSGASRNFEPMFDSTKTHSGRLTEAVDLVIDFATLGEYGLEPIERAAAPCEGRRHSGSSRSTGAWNAAVAHFASQS